MPTYEYKCQACDHLFEELQSITAKPLRKCPSCGKLKLVRLIGSGAGIIFKGSGFYQTDYRSEGYHKASKQEPSATPSKVDKTETKTEAKPQPSKGEGTKKEGGKKDKGAKHD
jgi:putative FmdB family regulatory protein